MVVLNCTGLTNLNLESPNCSNIPLKAWVGLWFCVLKWAMGDGFCRTRLSVHTAHASWLSPAAKVFTAAYRFRLSSAAQNLGEKNMKVWGHTGHCSQVVYKPSTYLEIMFYELNNICHHVHPSFHWWPQLPSEWTNWTVNATNVRKNNAPYHPCSRHSGNIYNGGD